MDGRVLPGRLDENTLLERPSTSHCAYRLVNHIVETIVLLFLSNAIIQTPPRAQHMLDLHAIAMFSA